MIENQIKSDEVIICTKDRPEALENAINSIQSQTHLPSRVLVVDSSSDLRSFEVIEYFMANSRLKLQHIKSKPGLTFQRNLGIENLLASTDVVHFLDDDIELMPNYLEEILSCFQRNQLALGVGGSIQNLPIHRIALRNRLVGLDSIHQGRVLRSGLNILNFTGSFDRSVDWFSGCSMSFRREVFSYALFDERRTGNGVGEDVDFCLRVKEFGEIIWTPTAKLFHFQSPINRLNAESNRMAALNHKLRLASDGLGNVRRFDVFFSEFFLSVFSIVRSLKGRNFHVIKREYRFWRSVDGI